MRLCAPACRAVRHSYPPEFVGSRATTKITAGAKTAFLQGDQWAYMAGIVAILLGAAIVFFMFLKREEEERLLLAYQAEDTRQAP